MIPWVHYVPLAYNGADLIQKVEWLKANDQMAETLALNARNCGKSYLRMEDYYCNAITALQAIANIEKSTDVTVFGPEKLIHHKVPDKAT